MNEELATARYVNLATFKRSGEAVETPVWCAADGDELFVFSARLSTAATGHLTEGVGEPRGHGLERGFLNPTL